jgi:hypothetical protein
LQPWSSRHTYAVQILGRWQFFGVVRLKVKVQKAVDL